MIEPATAWLVIVVGGAVTYATRASLLTLAHRARDLPPRVRDGLRMIPRPRWPPSSRRPSCARMGPLLLWHPRPIAALAAALVAWRTRGVIATLLVGGVALVGLTSVGIGG